MVGIVVADCGFVASCGVALVTASGGGCFGLWWWFYGCWMGGGWYMHLSEYGFGW